jgi:hypothetical protein
MTEQAKSKTMTKGEKDRRALASRMHETILSELVPENGEEMFQGIDQDVVLGAIADLAECLIVDCSWAASDEFELREMVDKVCGEMLKWARDLEVDHPPTLTR